MKKILFYIMACALLMCACNQKSDSSQLNDDEHITADSTQTGQQSRDSAKGEDMNGKLYVKMIDLTASVKEVRSQVDSTKTQIDELDKVVESKVSQMWFVLFLVGIVLLVILIIILFCKVNHLQQLHRRVDDELHQLGGRMDRLSESQKYTRPSSSVSQRDIDAFRTSLNKFDSRLKAVEKSTTISKGGQQRQQQQSPQIRQPKEERTVWFGINSKKIFPNELSASDVHIAFKGVYKSDSEVEFEPTDWARIKSFNDLSDVVTVQGNRGGSHMHIDYPGRAKKQTEGGRVYWQVTSPAIITIS